MCEDFVFGYRGLVFFFFFALHLRSVYLFPFLVFFSHTMFLWNFETASKPSSVFLLENCCVEVRLVRDGFCLGGNTYLRYAFFGIDRTDSHSLERKTRQIQT